MADFVIENGILTKYQGDGGDVVIPDGVTGIGDSAFSGCTSLQSITIPDSVMRIGWRAFSCCENLRSITIPDRVTKIDGWTFEKCTNLQSITIPDSVTSIGDYAFYACRNLQSINIPDHVTGIGSFAFNGCRALADTNAMVIVKNILFDYFGQEKYAAIPDNVTSIGDWAFYDCANLQNITIPDGVMSIGKSAFKNCINLQSITIPDSVMSIGEGAFKYCVNLQSITIPDSVTTLVPGSFEGCEKIRKFVLIPGSTDAEQNEIIFDVFGVKKLALSFLSGNMETNEILNKILKSKVTAKTFRTKYIPQLINNRETEAFIKLLSLIKKIEPEEIDSYIEKSENFVEIRGVLLEYKNRLYPPEVLNRMEEIQMEKDFGMREKTLADYKKEFKIVKEGNAYVIIGCKIKNPTVIIPGNIKGHPVRFREDVFQNNTNIQSIFIEEGVKEIGKNAFKGCSSLTNIEIPASVKDMADTAFHGRQKYITISTPEGSFAHEFAKKKKIKFQVI